MSARHPSSDSTEGLISRLAGDLRPVRRIWSPSRRLALWLGVLGLTLGMVFAVMALRPDVAAKLGQAPFAAQIAVLLAVAVASAGLALQSAVPGQEPPAVLSAAVITLAVVGLGGAYAGEPAAALDAARFLAMGWPCALAAIVVATVPLLMLLGAVRRGATFAPGTSGLLAGAAAFSAAAAALRLVCPLDERWHLIVWHLGPVAIGLSVSVALGLSWLSRWRRRR